VANLVSSAGVSSSFDLLLLDGKCFQYRRTDDSELSEFVRLEALKIRVSRGDNLILFFEDVKCVSLRCEHLLLRVSLVPGALGWLALLDVDKLVFKDSLPGVYLVFIEGDISIVPVPEHKHDFVSVVLVQKLVSHQLYVSDINLSEQP